MSPHFWRAVLGGIAGLWQRFSEWVRDEGGLVRRKPGRPSVGFRVMLRLPDGTTMPAIQYHQHEAAFARRAVAEGHLVEIAPGYLVTPQVASEYRGPRLAAPLWTQRQPEGVQ